MARWQSLAAVLLTIGFGILVAAIANSGNHYAYREVYGLMIAGYVCFLLAMILALIHHFNVCGHKILAVVGAICAFLAALFVLVGYGLWADRYEKHGVLGVHPYSATLYVTSAFLGLVGGVFLLISFLKGDTIDE